jgi:MT0933-like antitoxin protein
MGLLDKIKGLIKGNKSKVNSGLDKAKDVIGDKVGDKHAGKIEAGVDKAKDAINKLD